MNELDDLANGFKIGTEEVMENGEDHKALGCIVGMIDDVEQSDCMVPRVTSGGW